MPNGDRLTDISPDWFEVLPAGAAARSFFVHRSTGQSQWEFPDDLVRALSVSGLSASTEPAQAGTKTFHLVWSHNGLQESYKEPLELFTSSEGGARSCLADV